MELTLINENKLKITLSAEDMERLGITCEGLDYENTGTRRVFWELLDKARRQTGFDAASEKIFVQVYPDKAGGCHMYVTKLGSAGHDPGVYEKKYKTKLYTRAKNAGRAYVFSNSESLCMAAAMLCAAGYGGSSDVYCDDARYYLYIEDNKDPALERLCEYGVQIRNVSFPGYLTEHCSRLASGDGAEVFGRIYK